MAASVAFLNKLLDYGISGISTASGIYVGLYSGGAQPTDGGYSQQVISAFDAASSSLKAASARVNFAPTGASAGGWGYDEIRLYTQNTGNLLHSVSVTPAQFIANLDVHQILIRFSGQ